MKPESIAYGIAGVVFGLIAGWIIGTQQGGGRPQPTPVASQASAAPSAATTRPAEVDQAQVNALSSVAQREPSNAKARVDLGNLYFDAERYDDAIKWYVEALRLNPKDVNVSTDLGVCYYYSNQPDRALAQFDESLKLDPKHAKTLLNVGIVRAFGKQDLDGAVKAWEQVLQVAPGSPEAQAAKRALDSLKSAHPGLPGSQKPGS
ncbi:MAG TPA: tetratricopeptide repeat protein [Vicinamibacterales bacterium]|nr:tetratricopeptide repeat protein [Vicinamibacterales bacterium]